MKEVRTPRYQSYDKVPFYRKQWFFWSMYVTLTPLALGILLCGDIYYPKNGAVKSFGLLNRIVAVLIALAWLGKIGAQLTKG